MKDKPRRRNAASGSRAGTPRPARRGLAGWPCCGALCLRRNRRAFFCSVRCRKADSRAKTADSCPRSAFLGGICRGWGVSGVFPIAAFLVPELLYSEADQLPGGMSEILGTALFCPKAGKSADPFDLANRKRLRRVGLRPHSRATPDLSFAQREKPRFFPPNLPFALGGTVGVFAPHMGA